MGAISDAKVKNWQAKAGIEPVTGKRAKQLRDLSLAAHDLIQLLALEVSGIRGGDGYWHGCDEIGSLLRLMQMLWHDEIEALYPETGRLPNDEIIPF